MDGPRCGLCWFFLLTAVAVTSSLTMDEEATRKALKAAKSSRFGGELSLVLRGLQKTDDQQELLHFKADDDAATLYYNRETRRVHLESLHGSHLRSVSWSVGEASTTLTLVLHETRVRLDVGCKVLRSHPMPGKHDLSGLLANPKMRLYHDENLSLEVYGNEKTALETLGCSLDESKLPPSLMREDNEKSDVVEVRDFIRNEAAEEKQEEKMQRDDYRNNYIDSNGILPQQTTQRGDIPSNGIETCDDEVIRQLTLLRQIIENLRREIADQKATIDTLHAQLRQCCHRVPAPPPVERCTAGSCYPGY